MKSQRILSRGACRTNDAGSGVVQAPGSEQSIQARPSHVSRLCKRVPWAALCYSTVFDTSLDSASMVPLEFSDPTAK
jgi:hypothetical protein